MQTLVTAYNSKQVSATSMPSTVAFDVVKDPTAEVYSTVTQPQSQVYIGYISESKNEQLAKPVPCRAAWLKSCTLN
jgi:hypothetical protein